MHSSRYPNAKPGKRALLAWTLAGAMCALPAAPLPTHAASTYVQKPQPKVSPAKRLAPLAWDGALASIARGHSGDMAKRNYFSHESPEGHAFRDRYAAAHYRCALRVGDMIYGGAENLARGTLFSKITTVNGVQYFDWKSEDAIAADAVEGWMDSPGHRANILTPHWKHQGIGVVIAPDKRVYVTQNFC
jgi:uncharacterized protein YkwD